MPLLLRALAASQDPHREERRREQRGGPERDLHAHEALAVPVDVFEFEQHGTTPHGDHVSRHLTDGNIDLALMKWDREDREDAMLAGPGTRIHHWGLEVADREALTGAIREHGGQILSKPGALTLRLRAPDRTIIEVVARGRHEKRVVAHG